MFRIPPRFEPHVRQFLVTADVESAEVPACTPEAAASAALSGRLEYIVLADGVGEPNADGRDEPTARVVGGATRPRAEVT